MRLDNAEFNQKMCRRSLTLSIEILNLFKDRKISMMYRSMVNQLLKSSSSVAANYSAASRARSYPEFYAKICIVLEECDETLFWLNYLTEAGYLGVSEIGSIKDECVEILKITSKIRFTFKNNKKTMRGEV